MSATTTTPGPSLDGQDDSPLVLRLHEWEVERILDAIEIFQRSVKDALADESSEAAVRTLTMIRGGRDAE